MIRTELGTFGQEEWNNIVCQFEDLSLMQTWEFGRAKAKTGSWEVRQMVFCQGDEIVGAAQVMVRTIPLLDRGLAWVNRAPLCGKNEPSSIGTYIDLLRELADYWVNREKMYLRVVPPVLENEENHRCIEEIGLSYLAKGWASELLDLRRSQKELRMNLQQKWRNCLNKSERLGLHCVIGSSNDLVNELLFDYRRTLNRNKFKTGVSPELIKNLQELLPETRKMVVFAGRKGEDKLGSILIARYGDACMYLVGAVNEDGRKLNAGNYLLWRAVREMKEQGCRWFDLGGVDPERTLPGILHFKEGLQGEPYRLIGEFEAYKKNLLNRTIKACIKYTQK